MAAPGLVFTSVAHSEIQQQQYCVLRIHLWKIRLAAFGALLPLSYGLGSETTHWQYVAVEPNENEI